MKSYKFDDVLIFRFYRKVGLHIAGTDGSLAHEENSVISLMHHTFQTYGLGDIDFSLHADNCGVKMNQIHIFILN